MNTKDFTSELVAEALWNYLVHENFPNEVYDVGSKVIIAEIEDAEISAITKNGEHFRVVGTASIELEIDMGEGDSRTDNYPVAFDMNFNKRRTNFASESIQNRYFFVL
jgi:hypothetical protein